VIDENKIPRKEKKNHQKRKTKQIGCGRKEQAQHRFLKRSR
jgi:hypothetical protein